MLFARRVSLVEHIDRLLQILVCCGGVVDHRRFDLLMPHEHLNDFRVFLRLKERIGKGVPQFVKMYSRIFQPVLFQQAVEHCPRAVVRAHFSVIVGEDKVVRFAHGCFGHEFLHGAQFFPFFQSIDK